MAWFIGNSSCRICRKHDLTKPSQSSQSGIQARKARAYFCRTPHKPKFVKTAPFGRGSATDRAHTGVDSEPRLKGAVVEFFSTLLEREFERQLENPWIECARDLAERRR